MDIEQGGRRQGEIWHLSRGETGWEMGAGGRRGRARYDVWIPGGVWWGGVGGRICTKMGVCCLGGGWYLGGMGDMLGYVVRITQKNSPKYCTICAYIENNFCTLSRLSPANFALVLWTLHAIHLLFVIYYYLPKYYQIFFWYYIKWNIKWHWEKL